MYIVVRYGYCYVLIILLKFGVLVNFIGDNKEIFLYVVCRKGYDEIVYDLLMYGVDVYSVDKCGNMFLYIVLLGMVNKYYSSEIVENLLSRGVFVNKKNNIVKIFFCIVLENGLKDVI